MTGVGFGIGLLIFGIVGGLALIALALFEDRMLRGHPKDRP